MTNNTSVEQPSPATESAAPPRAARGRLNLGLATVIAIAAAAAMARAVLAQFLKFDDPDYVARNAAVQSLTLENLKTIWFSFDMPQYYPLVFTSYAIERALFGLNPQVFHATNVLLHALNSVLAFFLALRLTRSRLAAFIIGVLFAVHPVHVESVAWVTERKDVLSAAFFFGAFLLYLRYSETGRVRPYFWSLGLFFCGLLAKTMIATLPLWLLIVDYTERRRPAREFLAEKVPYFVVAVGMLAVTWFSEHQGWVPDGKGLEGVYSPLSAFAAPAFYLQKTLLPLDLSICYPPLHTNVALLVARIAVSVLLFAAAVWLLRRRSQAGMFLMFFFAGILPVLGLVPFRYVHVASPVADRFLYLPILGFLGVIAVALVRWAGGSAFRRGLVVLACLIAAAGLGVASWIRCGVFYDTESLFADALLKDSTSISSTVSRLNLGIHYLEQGRLTEAEPHLQEIARQVPYSGRPRYLLGLLRMKQGRVIDAIRLFYQALERSPKQVKYRLSLADALMKGGSPVAAERQYNRVLEQDPKNSGALDGLATIALTREEAERALSLYARALETARPNADRCYRMALAFKLLGRPDAAVRQLREAAHLNPKSAEVRLRLGDMLKAVGNIKGALDQYREGLRLSESHVELLNNFAWTIATSGDPVAYKPEEAVLAAERARDLTGGKIANVLDTLAAAYARAGDFDSAVDAQTQCIEILRDEDKPTDDEWDRLRLYRSEEPYTVPMAPPAGQDGQKPTESQE